MGLPPVIIHFILAFSMKETIQLLGIPDPEPAARSQAAASPGFCLQNFQGVPSGCFFEG